MRLRKPPLEKIEVADPEAKAKVSLVLQVLSGEKSVSGACRETGLKPMGYYRLEDRLILGMLQAAKMPPVRGRRFRDPAAEANSLATETELLRQEHRQMQALVRVTKKLFRERGRKRRGGPGRPRKDPAAQETAAPKAPSTPTDHPATPPPPATPPRRPGRPPLHPPAQA